MTLDDVVCDVTSKTAVRGVYNNNKPQPNINITLLSKIFQNLSFTIGLSEG